MLVMVLVAAAYLAPIVILMLMAVLDRHPRGAVSYTHLTLPTSDLV